jgi:hypothetical protein
MKKYKKNQEGQVLLLAILLMATVVTVVMTVTFRSRTETKITQLQQESDKTLAAAEAGIEAAIKQQAQKDPYSFKDLNINNLTGIDYDASTVLVDTTKPSFFVSPLIPRNQQYTFYLSDYSNGVFTGTPFVGALTLYYGSQNNDCSSISLELSTIYGNSPYAMERFIADEGKRLLTLDPSGVEVGSPANTTVGTTQFYCKADITIPPDAKVLFVRVMGTDTRIGTDNPQVPAQGRFIYSEARSTGGLVKKVKLFESYPQLPADLFVTSF